jgi:hypothetical protein
MLNEIHLKPFEGVQTPNPRNPNMRFASGVPKRLNDADWTAISNDIYQSVLASVTTRQALNSNLQSWYDAYGMVYDNLPKGVPYTSSSNLTLPYIPAQLESMVAYICGTVLVPRLMVVTGNTPEAAESAFATEKFYNAEVTRLRTDGKSYYSQLVELAQLSLRDGVGVAEVLWNRRRQRRTTVGMMPLTNESGMAMLDDNGQPLWKEIRNDVDVLIADYPEITPIPLKEFYLIPDESVSIEQAVGVARVQWMYEDELDRMVRAGLLDSDEVELALSYVPTGTSEVPTDLLGYYDKSTGQQLQIGQGQGSLTSRFFRNRGPIEVFRVHTRQYDLNGDGIPEENIVWLHYLNQRMLGFAPYDYATGKRPFFSFAPFPRPREFAGFSLVERLSGIQTEIDGNHNMRNDAIGLRVAPPMMVRAGSKLLGKRGVFGPNKMIEVESISGPDQTMQLMQIQDVPIASAQEESMLQRYGDLYTGLNGPSMGTQSSGKRSATESRQQNAAAGTRVALIAMRYRVFLREIFNFVHDLNRQYLTDDPQTMVDNQVYTLPLSVLSLDYDIGITGSTDPIDSITRRNEVATLFEVGVKMPIVTNSVMRQYYWMRMLLEAYGRSDIQQLIGTEQEAQQLQQQMQQQAAAMHAQGQQQQAAQQPQARRQ